MTLLLTVPPVNYYVVDTDYSTYSCIYSCFGYFSFRAELYWIFARNQTQFDEARNICKDVFSQYNIDFNKLENIEQGHETCGDYKDLIYFDDQMVVEINHQKSTNNEIESNTIIIDEGGSDYTFDEQLSKNDVKEIVKEVINLLDDEIDKQDSNHGQLANAEEVGAAEMHEHEFHEEEEAFLKKNTQIDNEPKVNDICSSCGKYIL